MPVSKKAAEKADAERTYPTAKLIRSKALAGYQKDFARAILVKEAYTIREARQALEEAMEAKGGN